MGWARGENCIAQLTAKKADLNGKEGFKNVEYQLQSNNVVLAVHNKNDYHFSRRV